MRIVFVDDDEDFLFNTEIYLKGLGYDIRPFSRAADAIKELGTINPHVIVTDVMMPGMHGLEFREIATTMAKHIEIVVISANSKEQVVENLGDLGDSRYFRKPLGDDFEQYLRDKSKQVSERSKEDEGTSLNHEFVDEALSRYMGIPTHSGHRFRFIPVTDSDPNRSSFLI